MSIQPKHIAEGAEARMRQLLSALEVSRPVVPGLKRLAWDVSGPIRGIFPAVQEALGQPGQVNLVSVQHGDPRNAVMGDGVRLPARPMPGPVQGVPREGARLLGRVEHALQGTSGVVAAADEWAAARRRTAGRRGHGDAPDTASEGRMFGMALADAALGVAGAPSLGLPSGFAFSYCPEGEFLGDDEMSFAEGAADVLLDTNTGLGIKEAMFESFRLLGHLEGLNQATLTGMVEREPTAGGAGVLGAECARAALGLGSGLEATAIPEALSQTLGSLRAMMAEDAPRMRA